MSSPHATGNGGRTGTGIPVAAATPKAKMSKRQKAKISRGIQYGLLVVIAAVIAVVADWPTLIDTFGRVDIAADMFPDVITKALKNTVVFTGLGFILGLVIAIVLALMRLSSPSSTSSSSAACPPSSSSSSWASAFRWPSPDSSFPSSWSS